ncbi:MAG: hypothetical protein H6619_00490 [Deltaproteobacteria bacterium]|nr:hypothetical protein [Deltaproteobacteria bacterium]
MGYDLRFKPNLLFVALILALFCPVTALTQSISNSSTTIINASKFQNLRNPSNLENVSETILLNIPPTHIPQLPEQSVNNVEVKFIKRDIYKTGASISVTDSSFDQTYDGELPQLYQGEVWVSDEAGQKISVGLANLSLLNDEVRGGVVFRNGTEITEQYTIERSVETLANPDELIVSKKNTQESTFECGSHEELLQIESIASSGGIISGSTGSQGSGGTSALIAAPQHELEIATEAACDYVEFHGGVTNAMYEILTALNLVDTIYQVELGISLKVTFQHFWSDCSNPSHPYSTTSHLNTISDFTQYWNSNFASSQNYDVAHLFSMHYGEPFVGKAWLGATCSTTKYGITLRPSELSFAYDLIGITVAHEIGHNLGAVHDTNCFPEYDIMCPNLALTYNFSNQSQTDIGNSISNFTCMGTNPSNTNPPQFTSPSSITISEEQSLNFPVNAIDPDGDFVDIVAVNLPTGFSFDGTSLYFQPNYSTVQCENLKTFTIDLIARDAAQHYTIQKLAVTILNTHRAATLNPISPIFAGLNTQTTHNFSITNPDNVPISIALNFYTSSLSASISNTPGAESISFTPNYSGFYEMDAILTDCMGEKSTQPLKVIANNNPTAPFAKLTYEPSVYEGQTTNVPIQVYLPPGVSQNDVIVSQDTEYGSGSFSGPLTITNSNFSWAPDFTTFNKCSYINFEPPEYQTRSFALKATNVLTGESSTSFTNIYIFDTPAAPQLLDPANYQLGGLSYVPGQYTKIPLMLYGGGSGYINISIPDELMAQNPPGTYYASSGSINGFKYIYWTPSANLSGTQYINFQAGNCESEYKTFTVELKQGQTLSEQPTLVPSNLGFDLTILSANGKTIKINHQLVSDQSDFQILENSNCTIRYYAHTKKGKLFQSTPFAFIPFLGNSSLELDLGKIPPLKKPSTKKTKKKSVYIGTEVACNNDIVKQVTASTLIKTKTKNSLKFSKWLNVFASKFWSNYYEK